jgi:hypothetical protein
LIQNNIAFVRKSLEIVKETLDHSANMEKYFIDSINKTLLSHIPPRKIKTITKQQAIVDLEKGLDHLEIVLKIGMIENFFDIYRQLENFSLIPRNILVRAYLDNNIWQNNTFFGQIKTKDLALNALEEFMIVKGKEIVSNPEVSKFIQNSQNLLEELFASNLRSRTKQRREAVKLYQHINVFAHDAVLLFPLFYSLVHHRSNFIRQR